MLVATTVAEYREQLQEFFSKQEVPFYNEFEVSGVDKTHKKTHRVDNWFSDSNKPIDHIAFFTMVNDQQADLIIENLNDCKANMPNCNIRAYVLNVEKHV